MVCPLKCLSYLGEKNSQVPKHVRMLRALTREEESNSTMPGQGVLSKVDSLGIFDLDSLGVTKGFLGLGQFLP